MVYVNAIEIGTSDFEFVQVPAEARVILVEPVPKYLENALKIAKESGRHAMGVEAAVVPRSMSPADREGLKIFYVDPDKVDDMPQWIRGCNCVNRVHPEIRGYFQQQKLDDSLIKSKDIAAETLTQIIERADAFFGDKIDSVGVLKYDTEGMDPALVVSAAHELYKLKNDTGRDLFPDFIKFESNYLNKTADVSFAIDVWKRHGYTLVSRAGNTVMRRISKPDS